MRKILITVIIVLLAVSMLGGCAFLKNAGQIEDANGEEDISLVTLTDDDLKIKSGNSASYMSAKTQHDSKTTVKTERFSGVDILETVKVEGKTLTFTVSSTLESGNFRIAVVKNAETVVGDIAVGASDQVLKIENATGEYRLIIAGESAEFSLEYTAEQS